MPWGPGVSFFFLMISCAGDVSLAPFPSSRHSKGPRYLGDLPATVQGIHGHFPKSTRLLTLDVLLTEPPRASRDFHLGQVIFVSVPPLHSIMALKVSHSGDQGLAFLNTRPD